MLDKSVQPHVDACRVNVNRMKRILLSSLIGLVICSHQISDARPNCSKFDIDGTASQSLAQVGAPRPGGCQVRLSNGYPIPDPTCTPGAINPQVTTAVLQDREFSTKCERDQATDKRAKEQTYAYYGIKRPSHNTGRNQVCELDHLVSLELGGADTLDNIWPQCGPSGVALKLRYFKQKDKVENYLASQVKTGNMSLEEAQKGIAADWTQYLEAANHAGKRSRRHKKSLDG